MQRRVLFRNTVEQYNRLMLAYAVSIERPGDDLWVVTLRYTERDQTITVGPTDAITLCKQVVREARALGWPDTGKG